MKGIKSNELLFSIHDPQGVKLLSQHWVNFSHLNKQNLDITLKECVSPMCDCGLEIESTQHFLMLCFIMLKDQNSLIVSTT